MTPPTTISYIMQRTRVLQFRNFRFYFNYLMVRVVSSESGSHIPILTLFTKRTEHCSLCEDAKEALKPYNSMFIYEERYIDDPENSVWLEKYRYDIPVIHINGKYVMKHKVNKRKLLEELKEFT